MGCGWSELGGIYDYFNLNFIVKKKLKLQKTTEIP